MGTPSCQTCLWKINGEKAGSDWQVQVVAVLGILLNLEILISMKLSNLFSAFKKEMDK